MHPSFLCFLTRNTNSGAIWLGEKCALQRRLNAVRFTCQYTVLYATVLPNYYDLHTLDSFRENLEDPTAWKTLKNIHLTSSSCPGFAVPHAGHWMQSPGWRMKHPGHSHEPALGLNLSIRLAGGAAGSEAFEGSAAFSGVLETMEAPLTASRNLAMKASVCSGVLNLKYSQE